MYRIVRREQFGPVTFLWEVEAPNVARAARPGHFLMVRIDETGERIPLTVADYDAERGTVTVVVQAVGKTTRQMMALPEGAQILDFVGPLGLPSDIRYPGKVVLVGGGLGVAPVFPQLRAYKEKGNATFSVIGFRSKDLMFWVDKFERFSDELHVATDDGSFGMKGRVTDALEKVLDAHPDIREVVAIGPLVMMRACAEVTRPRGIKTMVSLNSIMVDGTGMCGSCRVTVDGLMRFACVDGPDFDGHKVDFDELMLRQQRFAREEQEAMERYRRETEAVASLPCTSGDPMQSIAVLRARHESEALLRTLPSLGAVPDPLPPLRPGEQPVVKTIRTIAPTRTPMPAQPAEIRAHNFEEVNLGYSLDQALCEADRCMVCKKARCVTGCPVGIDIPGFISAVARRDLKQAYRVLKSSNALPGVCGRVCPQESQCEAACIVGHKLQPVAVGRLERFVADFAVSRDWDEVPDAPRTGKKVAVVGSGPAGLACAGDLVKAGVEVTVFEALHVAGGVLKYGIPGFRLPSHIIDTEIESLRRMGVRFELDAVIGKLYTIPQILGEMGYDAVFVGTGCGIAQIYEHPRRIPQRRLFRQRAPHPGESDAGLRKAPLRHPRRNGPAGSGGGGREHRHGRRPGGTADRRGGGVHRVSPQPEGIAGPGRGAAARHGGRGGFLLADQPGSDPGQRHRMGGRNGMCRDGAGRARRLRVAGALSLSPVPRRSWTWIPWSRHWGPAPTPSSPGPRRDWMSTGGATSSPTRTTMATSIPGVYAGGDIVSGAATVILAMGAGRRAAAGILGYLGVTRHAALSASAPASNAANEG